MKKTVSARPDRGACFILDDGACYCVDPLGDALQLLGKRWVLVIVAVLGNAGPTRFNELKRSIPGITPRGLSDNLTVLQHADVVRRSVDTEANPPGVRYELTPRGHGLRKALLPLVQWAGTEVEVPAGPA